MSLTTFKQYLEDYMIEDLRILKTNAKTDTAEAAAKAHGVPVSNIVKSLVITDDIQFFILLVPGDKKVDLDKVSKELDDDMRMALPPEVKDETGYSIGGVPPFGHKKKLRTFILDGFPADAELIAAAGSDNSVFKVNLERLVELTNAEKI